ncbi:UBX domain-containing protein 4-like [Dorcoceras hygrometricum]|nr:UBX domain-containing protein 4-like [Dorcoceras hygrometricum]
MDQFLSSLAFKGTIAEAITEAKLQKKLFVVYIAGDKPESKLLETSTWNNPTVSEALAKYCIFLQISEGSSEASYFSAIYPQNDTPCITVIGYNGARLWQKGGFVSADILSTSLEKTWLSLHLQETTAAFLSAALTSKISGSSSSDLQTTVASYEQQTIGAEISGSSSSEPQSTGASSEQQTTWAKISGSSSSEQQIPETSSEQQSTGAYGPLSLKNDLSISLDAELPKNSEARVKRRGHDDASEEPDCKRDGETAQASHSNISTNYQIDEPQPTNETEYLYLNPERVGQGEPDVLCKPVSEKSLDISGLCSGGGNEVSQDIFNETVAASQAKNPETAEVEKVDGSASAAIKSNNVFFNIRLPDGSLQAKFSVMDTLRVVYEYIDDNQTSRLGSFDLAIPYPRHVFSDQDLDSTLSALGLFDRQTLTVVQRNQNKMNYQERSSVHYSTDLSSSSKSNEGYWASVKSLISYVNPFSYLRGGGDAQSSPEELNGGSSHSPSATVDSSSRNTPESDKNSNNRSRQKTYRFGANIHTLKHDEDDDDKNRYWNGNSTQFGGSDDTR